MPKGIFKRKRKSLTERFWLMVLKKSKDECWPWLGSLNKRYGEIRDSKKRLLKAHRVSWEIHFGPIPDGIKVLHECDYPPCVNPYHLFLGTQYDNVIDMFAKGRNVNPQAKLIKYQVIEIKNLCLFTKLTREEIGKRFGVSRQCVNDIVLGRTWNIRG